MNFLLNLSLRGIGRHEREKAREDKSLICPSFKGQDREGPTGPMEFCFLPLPPTKVNVQLHHNKIHHHKMLPLGKTEKGNGIPLYYFF
jgi:hypothetical protein